LEFEACNLRGAGRGRFDNHEQEDEDDEEDTLANNHWGAPRESQS